MIFKKEFEREHKEYLADKRNISDPENHYSDSYVYWLERELLKARKSK